MKGGSYRKERFGTRFRRTLKITTPFVLACGGIALLYFFYRIVLVAVPVVSVQESIFHPRGDASIVCGKEGGDALKDPAPVISASYQQRIQTAAALSPNMVKNPDFAAIDGESQLPVGYSYTLEHSSVTYDHTRDPDGAAFVRTTTASTITPMPAWQIDPVNISAERSYAYSFWYRSSSPVDVTRVTTKPDGTQYDHVVTLSAVTGWTQFTGEYTNSDDRKSLQVIISGTEKGVVDTKGYAVHQIPDAELRKGMISVAFDDGWESTYDKALPLLQKYSIPTTQYVIAEVAVNNVPEYMNIDHLKQLHMKGHEIGSHSLTHCNQTVLDQQGVEDNAARSKQLLEAQVGPIKSFAYPLGQYNQLTQSIYQKHFPLIRTSDPGYNNRYFDETNIHSMAIVETTSDKEFNSWIAYAKQHKVWLVVAYHRVDASGEYSVSSAVLEKQLALIRASGLTITPVSAAAEMIRPAQR